MSWRVGSLRFPSRSYKRTNKSSGDSGLILCVKPSTKICDLRLYGSHQTKAYIAGSNLNWQQGGHARSQGGFATLCATNARTWSKSTTDFLDGCFKSLSAGEGKRDTYRKRS
ncbi:hypothetical protein PoB_006177000 [Plakobranchus ocellatus]|uniref:Uncharacterized protein n=1 Tax=Plakobranchus ocellatus TaxID=259542 RepID=A0AAV4CTN5_9GAST|nr:hypothetical protein PoB_006177000 [Plakobranchus ocellatus]